MLEFLIVVQQVDAKGQLFVDKNVIHAQRSPHAAESAVFELDAALVLVAGGFRARVDNAGRAAQAEKDGVGAALEIDAIHIVAVPRNIGQEVIDRGVGRSKTAHARVLVRVGEFAALVGKIVITDVRHVAVNIADLGVGGVLQQRFAAGGADVFQHLLRHNRDGGTDVAELGVQAVTSK